MKLNPDSQKHVNCPINNTSRATARRLLW